MRAWGRAMVRSVDYGPWVDLAAEALDPTAEAFPVERIAGQLREMLRARAVSLNWAIGGQAGAKAWPPIVRQGLIEDYLRSGALWCDPLVCWFDVTAQWFPQSSSRVPD